MEVRILRAHAPPNPERRMEARVSADFRVLATRTSKTSWVEIRHFGPEAKAATSRRTPKEVRAGGSMDLSAVFFGCEVAASCAYGQIAFAFLNIGRDLHSNLTVGSVAPGIR